MQSLRKPADGLVSRYLNRPISLAITRRIRDTGIRPNHVTVVTMLLGLAGGWVLSRGGYAAGVWGTLLLQAQSVLDGVDGELARLKSMGTRLGQWLDTVSDDLGELAFLVGATWASEVPWVRLAGWCGAGAYVAAKAAMYTVLATVYKSGDLLAFSWKVDRDGGLASRLKLLFKHDFFCLLAFVLACLGLLDVALLLGAAGAFVVLATVAWQFATQGIAPHET